MKPLEIALIVFCAAVVVGVIVARVILKKKGKTGCDCGCADCSACAYCRQANRVQKGK